MKEQPETIISHVRQADMAVQSNENHQQGVAEKAERYAAEFGMGEWGRVLGLLHDKGKEQHDFQTYIKKVSGLCSDLMVCNHPNHAYVGALIAQKYYKPMLPFLAYPIMGHHTGLYDYDEYESVLTEKKVPTDVDASSLDIKLSAPKLKALPQPYECNHIIRMLFSCLVDADFLDTEQFMNEEQAKMRGGKKSLGELLPLLSSHLEKLKSAADDTLVNRIRNQVQQACIRMAGGEPGFYSLTVPTGGGKTLSSLVWAMRHALKHGKKRIVIAIPYTSIIVQTAQTLRKIFGAENVLEHHYNVSFEELADNKDETDELALQMRLATENWDYPIVVTTNVQLFESMYSYKPSHCRKLHNLCNSVLILDEVQTLPTDYLQPIVNALKTYQRQFGMSVLFSTASQPVLEGEHHGCNPQVVLKGIEKITEIIPKDYALHDKLRRVQLHFDERRSTYDDIASRLAQYDRVLCVVNTRKDAAEIYNRLPKDDDAVTLHLSRMMCPIHVSETISKVKDALAEKRKIRVVSTQLIEAGVDIDFPVVFRQETGLDSILQAAGRCNREGKLGISDTYVFMLDKPLPPGFMSRTNSARMDMMEMVDDKFSTEAMREYFRFLYSKVNTFDKAGMSHMLEVSKDMMFRTAGEAFHLIDDNTTSVSVNWRHGMDFVERLKKNGLSYHLMKQLSGYSVNIRQYDLQLLQQAGAIEEVLEGIYAISNPAFYDENVGLVVTNQWLEETYIL